MKALVTAGGHGTRLRPITHTINKHLIPLAGKPMIFCAIEKIAAVGVKEIFININEGETEIQKVVGNGSRWGVHITFFEQKGGPKGLADVVAQAEQFIGDDSFIFYLGDNIILQDITGFVREFEEKKLNCLLAISRVQDASHFGVPVIENGQIKKVIEKPAVPPSPFAVTGIYVYDKNVFKAVRNLKPSARGELEISDTHTWLIQNGYKVGYKEITGWWKDTGRAEDLLEANRLLLGRIKESNKGSMEDSVVIQGKVSIGAGSSIEGKTVIRGPVSIGSSCIIRDTYIGPFTSIGNKVKLSGAEIEHSLVFDNSNISIPTRIVDSLIGAGTTIAPSRNSLPTGHRLLIGNNSIVEL